MPLTARHATLMAPLVAVLALSSPLVFGADATAASARKTTPAAKPANSRAQLKDQAKGLALATETVEQISEAQLAVASRVLVGEVDCEFDQKIAVAAVEGQPGHFNVGYKKAVYRMVPQETTTGAVRLEDKKAGVVWLQIPTKSMLMNAKIGQRMVDACTHATQRAAVAAARAAAAAPGATGTASDAPTLGVAPPVAAAAAVPAATTTTAAPAAAPAATAATPAAEASSAPAGN